MEIGDTELVADITDALGDVRRRDAPQASVDPEVAAAAQRAIDDRVLEHGRAGGAHRHRIRHDVVARHAGGPARGGDGDAEVGGDVDVGPSFPQPPSKHGRNSVGRGLLARFSGRTGTTLVSHPVNGLPGVLAFREHTLVGILQLEIEDDLIVDVHAIVDPAKLALVDVHLSRSTTAP